MNLRSTVAEYAGLFGVLVLLVVFFSFKAPNFASSATFLAVANQIPSQVLVAIGVTFVLIVAEIDLSVGSILGLSGAVLGVLFLQKHLPMPIAICACIGVGILCGLFNGLVTTLFGLPSFIVTLGALEIARGGTYWVSQSQTQYIGSPIEGIAATSWFGLSLPFIVALVLVGCGQILLSKTVFGRRVIAVGSNPEAARYSGIDPGRIKRAVFLMAGVLASFAALVDTSRFQSADPNAGIGLELQAIAAVVIGGTSLMGGRGSVVSSFVGVLIIAVLGAGLAAMGAADEVKRVVTGCVIVVAVILDRYRHRLKARTA
ncbi:MAG TPA: ABC transporter permease [Fimbriimonas sp.]|nr:ABC transporter permease [Fimbriimonas sp.]